MIAYRSSSHSSHRDLRWQGPVGSAAAGVWGGAPRLVEGQAGCQRRGWPGLADHLGTRNVRARCSPIRRCGSSRARRGRTWTPSSRRVGGWFTRPSTSSWGNGCRSSSRLWSLQPEIRLAARARCLPPFLERSRPGDGLILSARGEEHQWFQTRSTKSFLAVAVLDGDIGASSGGVGRRGGCVRHARPGAGCRVPGAGCRVPGAGCRPFSCSRCGIPPSNPPLPASAAFSRSRTPAAAAVS